jgi:hypothetical protein
MAIMSDPTMIDEKTMLARKIVLLVDRYKVPPTALSKGTMPIPLPAILVSDRKYAVGELDTSRR